MRRHNRMQRTASPSSSFNGSWLPGGGLSGPAIPFSTAADHVMCRSWALSRLTVRAEVCLQGHSIDSNGKDLSNTERGCQLYGTVDTLHCRY